jgi:hypothetical protein
MLFFGIFFFLYGLFSMFKPKAAAKFRYYFIVKDGEISNFALLREVLIGVMLTIIGIVFIYGYFNSNDPLTVKEIFGNR